MNPWATNSPVLGELDFSYPIPSPPTLPTDGQITTGQSSAPQLFSPSPALHSHAFHHAESFDAAPPVPTTSMGPPAKPRKRKAPTLRADDWEPYEDRILELHITQNLPLPKVMKIIEDETGFTAELRQYRTCISRLKKDKNVKPNEMKAIVRKRQKRKLVEVDRGELIFEVRGRKVEPQNIDRWMKRHHHPEGFLYAPSPAASTPSDVGCRTVSERDSPAPSPAYSAGIPCFSPAAVTSVAHSPPMLSPALSISSIVRPQDSTFAGQSPASTYQYGPGSPPAFTPGSPPTLIASQRQSTSADPQYRYLQKEEQGLREELSFAENLHRMSHPRALGVLSRLGEVLIRQGRYRSAEEVVRRLVEGRRVTNGDNEVSTLAALNLLGDVLRYQGLYAKAEKLHRRTFESRKAILGDEHPDTLISMGNLAATYGKQGRLKEAEELEVQVLETKKRVLGDEHPKTLTSMCNLAATVLGDEHPETLASMGNLASTYWSQQRWKEAKELEVQVMEALKRVLGVEHPDTLISMANLACTWKSVGQNKEAVSLMEDCLELQRKRLGPRHPDTEASLYWLNKWQADDLALDT
ncbi:TPR-like protein [Mytilinidion resinicola]|uniref:TPR-like protein n=1 Tax=Mytilinidion resinicola TaxID=574789 RepID=A0A6A6YRZ9_9PEZI|nr:TPR-like protein [Mytilinidion resinicola]KAF2811289.1 TPR-like protein [Mytilinidion resinicola]